MKKPPSQYVINGVGSAIMFTMSLGIAWLLVQFLHLSWDRALLVQILWLTALNRWHQPSAKHLHD